MAVKVGVGGTGVEVGGTGVAVGGTGVCVFAGMGVGVGVAVGNALAVGVRLGAGDGVAVGAGVFAGIGVGGTGVGVFAGMGVGVLAGMGDGVFVGRMGDGAVDGVAVDVGVFVGVLVGVAALGVATAMGAETGVGDSSDRCMRAATIAPAKMTAAATKKRGAFKIRSLPLCHPMIRGNENRAPATTRLHAPKARHKPAAYGLVSKTSAFRTRSAYSIPPQFVRLPTTPAK